MTAGVHRSPPSRTDCSAYHDKWPTLSAIRNAERWLDLRERIGLDIAAALALLVLEDVLERPRDAREDHLRNVAEISAEALRAILDPTQRSRTDVRPLLERISAARAEPFSYEVS